MKIQWSVFFSLLLLTTLAGCGGEQFGSVPQTESNKVQAPTGFQQMSCTSYTLIKPKVDILYVLDNSGSMFYISDAAKTAITNTVNSISAEFDYRVISTKLIQPPNDPTPYDDYFVMTNSSDPLPDPGKLVITPSQLISFVNDGSAMERGLGKTYEFMNQHKNSLFRNGAYQIVVLVSNGRDDEVQDNQTFPTVLQNFKNLKTSLNSPQLRFLAVTATSSANGSTDLCANSKNSSETYGKMARELYNWSGATDNNTLRDVYNICGGSALSGLFTAVNSSIKQIVIPHTYRFWPVNFATASDTRNSFGNVEVYKVNGNSAPVLMNPSSWTWEATPSGSRNIREPGTEVVSGYHFIRFSNELISYPECIQIKSSTRTEYFKYVVLPREPNVSVPMSVRINGNVLPSSAWTYRGYMGPVNIKAPYPNAGDDQPASMKSGYMIELNGSSNYYKSGDSVEVNYQAAGV